MGVRGMDDTMPRHPASSFTDEDDAQSDVLVDFIRYDGAIIAMNDAQCQVLRLDADMSGCTTVDLYTAESNAEIQALFDRDLPQGFQVTLELTMMARGRRRIATLARCRKIRIDGYDGFRLSKIVLGPLVDILEDVRRDSLVLRQIIDNASEGHWCIEFLEPIDISAPRQEVIDQVFENASIWLSDEVRN